MKNPKCPSCDFPKDKKWDEKSKKYPKPWTKATHDQYLKDMGMSEKEHDEWHRKHKKN